MSYLDKTGLKALWQHIIAKLGNKVGVDDIVTDDEVDAICSVLTEEPLEIYTDKTLTQSGAAADAKTTGDKIASLNNKITSVAGSYELIETIVVEEDMAIERTQEPDGTPYNFSAISIRAKKAEGVILSNSLNLSAYMTKSKLSLLFMPPTNKVEEQWGYAEVKQYKGFWERERATDWSIYNYTATPSLVKIPMYDMKALEGESIYRVYGASVQAGLTIEIWGVRANA